MSSEAGRYRLITRSDFDGLVCAVLLKHLDLLGEIRFAHPKDVQDGKIEVSERDVLANMPYFPGCYRCFDHHESEEIRTRDQVVENFVLDATAESAARVVYEYYGGPGRFPDLDPQMLEAVDKADSARFSMEEVLDPHGWDLLSFVMDPRTGLGRFRNFRVSNYQLMMDLVDYCKDHAIDEILALPDVQERIDLYRAHQEPFRDQLRRCASVHDELVVLDLCGEETIYTGNRFVIYALYPDQNISIHVLWGVNRQNTVFAIGKSIFNRTSRTNVGSLALEYGGGGHAAAGTCQVPNTDADRVLGELIERITHCDAD